MTMKNIIRRAVEAAFSYSDFEEAIAEQIAFELDYDNIAADVLSKCDISDAVHEAAVEYALDLADLP